MKKFIEKWNFNSIDFLMMLISSAFFTFIVTPTLPLLIPWITIVKYTLLENIANVIFIAMLGHMIPELIFRDHKSGEYQYLNLVKKILKEGNKKGDRTGTGVKSIFGHQMRFDLSKGFPLLTTKKLHLKSIIGEIIWLISGSTNNNDLEAMGVKIWREWADEDGDLGPIYGKQWRDWEPKNGESIDQIKNVIDQIKSNPDSRRLIVSAWNVGELNNMSLMPCHTLFQFYINDGKLSCQLYQRSSDVMLGLPYNIASYSLLTMMIAQVCDLEVGEFIHTIGDAHIYSNHYEQMKLQLTRKLRPLPTMKLNKEVKNIFDFKLEDFTLSKYDPHPHIKGKVAV